MPVLQTQKMSQNGHEERSCTERPSPPDATSWPGLARPVRASERRSVRRPQQPSLPLLIHLPATPSGALPHLTIWAVRPACQRHGNRQYLRISCQITFLGSRMGKKYPILPRTPSNRPSRVAKTRLVGTVRSKRVSVLYAPPCGPAVGRCGAPRVPHGGRPSRRLHGPHQDLPGTSGEAKGTPCGFRRVLLSEGHRSLHDRCMRPIRRPAHRKSTGEVPVRPRGVLSESVSQPAHEVRQTPPPTTLPKNSELTSHRTTLLRAVSRQNSHRNSHKGYAAVRQFVLVAVHGDHVTYDVEAAGSGMIHALRLPAVPAGPAVRPVPEVPARSPARGRCHVLQRIPRKYGDERRVLRF